MFIFLDNCRYMLLYSKDLLHWEEGQVISLYTAAECPDLFYLPLDGGPLPGKMGAVGLHGHLSGGQV